MKKPVQILLILALFPMVGSAREETLEERKQRIVRKYLRERAAISQSDMVVPSDLAEDERITDSEKFKDAEVSLEREDSVAKPYVPPPQQRPMQHRNNSNWLLDDSTDADAGYGLFGSTATDPSIDQGDDLWSSWGGDTLGEPYQSREQTDRRYNPNPRRENVEQGFANGRRGQPEQRGYYTQSGTEMFGRMQPNSTQSDYNSGLGLQDNTRTYGSSPDQGLLNTPFRQIDSNNTERQQREQDGMRRESPTGYQPYKSQYERQREQRQQQWRNASGSQQEKEQEYQRPNQYQQFKDRNKVYDPLSDDAYLNQNRR